MNKTDVNWKDIPDAPGVYRFLGPDGTVLYVGKATSLKDRVKSYFAQDIGVVRSPLVEKVVRDASALSFEETDSVLEALILEAKLIKKLLPPGNTDQKDNKSFAYLVVTKEAIPRFLVVRERELSASFPPSKIKKIFGPFLSAAQLREALKIIRKIFPIFDTPFPLGGVLSPAQAKHVKFNQSIGLYPELNADSYGETVRYVCELFDGKKRSLVQSLKRAMARAARNEAFEEAQILKRQIFALEHIRDVTLIKEEYRIPETASFRIEAYDIAHIQGDAPRGVMVVVVDGEVQPKEYRTFTIRKAKAGDDIAALSEVIERRALHREWSYPQVVVIDGGATHLRHAKGFLKLAGMAEAEVVSVVKDERHKPKNILGSPKVRHTHESSILLANAEAHRFAIARHRRAFRKRM